MNVWYHSTTIFSQRRTLQIAGLLTLCVAFITMLFLTVPTAHAETGVNKTLSFQGRLLDKSGNPVADGYYNIQFKIYQDGNGTAAGNPGGTLKWTETYVNDGGTAGVHIKNGYLSVNLGSLTPFGSQVDWNQDTLWLSMNIAGSSAVCSTFGTAPCLADGEMTPMKRLTSSPYALNSGMLNGKTSDDFVHIGTEQQTGSLNLSGSVTSLVMRAAQSISTPIIDALESDGTISIGESNASTISIASGNTLDQSVDIATGEGDKLVAIGSTSGNSSLNLASGEGGVTIDSTGSVAINLTGENSFTVNGKATFAEGVDINGVANASDGYSINGTAVLNSNAVNFNGQSTSKITAAENQSLALAGESVQIGDGANGGGNPTLLTLDRSSETPTATGDAVLGSMYYDTTLGKVQCYEADGWGACSSSPDNFVTLSPEYTNAVTNGTGTGTMTSDICSDALNLNDGSEEGMPTICGTDETYNFYNWTTTEATAQTKDIYVTYQLPTNFTGFVDGSTSLVGRTNDSAASVDLQIYKNTSTGLVACGAATEISSGLKTTWQKVTTQGYADPSNCGFTAGDSIVFKISLTSAFTTTNTNAYASTLSFAFSDN